MLTYPELLEFCKSFKPDVVFEMNRSKSQIPELPASVKHIAWIVDFMGRDINDFQESEIIYLFSYNGWSETYTNNSNSLVDWLPPGFNPRDYYDSNLKKLTDFSFVGHIPLPWNKSELERIVFSWPGGEITFEDFFKYYSQRWHPQVKDSFLFAAQIIKDISGGELTLPAGSLRYDVACRASRTVQRCRLVNMMKGVSKNIKLYGPPNWRAWPEYARYYQKFLTEPSEIRTVYQTTKINFHEGVGPHFRLFDCMAAGGLIFCANGPDRDAYGELNCLFEPQKHYISFGENNFAELTEFYLDNGKIRQEISHNASALVHEKHTWRHRAEKICQDFYKL